MDSYSTDDSTGYLRIYSLNMSGTTLENQQVYTINGTQWGLDDVKFAAFDVFPTSNPNYTRIFLTDLDTIYYLDFSTVDFTPITDITWQINLKNFINNNGGYVTEMNSFTQIKVVESNINGSNITYTLITVADLVSSYEFKLNFWEQNGTTM